MRADVQAHFGLVRPFQGAGTFETDHQRSLVREVCAAVQIGRLVVVSGLVGSGKTHLLRRIKDELARAGASRSLSPSPSTSAGPRCRR
jgi:type II secretory pathway predicted ATPase ExeA